MLWLLALGIILCIVIGVMVLPGEIDLDEYKICPKCDELIKAEALTCIYCGNIDFVPEYKNKEIPLTYCNECGAVIRKEKEI